jgi:hypothetical protein
VGTGRQKRQRKARQEYIEAQIACPDVHVWAKDGRALPPGSPERRRLLKKTFAMMTDEELGIATANEDKL